MVTICPGAPYVWEKGEVRTEQAPTLMGGTDESRGERRVKATGSLGGRESKQVPVLDRRYL